MFRDYSGEMRLTHIDQVSMLQFTAQQRELQEKHQVPKILLISDWDTLLFQLRKLSEILAERMVTRGRVFQSHNVECQRLGVV